MAQFRFVEDCKAYVRHLIATHSIDEAMSFAEDDSADLGSSIDRFAGGTDAPWDAAPARQSVAALRAR